MLDPTQKISIINTYFFKHMKLTRFSLLSHVATPAILFATSLAAFAQEEGLLDTSDAAAAGVQGHTIWEMMKEGGPLIMFIWFCILLTSMVMVTLIIKLFIAYRVPAMAPAVLVASIREAIDAGNYQEAWEISNANKPYYARVMRGVLERIGLGKEVTENAIIENATREAQFLKSPNSYLSVIGVIAPMIGLLGTVIGMMGAFSVLGSSGVADPRLLAMRIGEVLMATASGLFIAIPAFVAYYYFRNQASLALVQVDAIVIQSVEHIPYDEIHGISIGAQFSAGAGGDNAEAATSHRVSKELTTNCPVCNNTVTPGENPCPHCNSTLDWA